MRQCRTLDVSRNGVHTLLSYQVISHGVIATQCTPYGGSCIRSVVSHSAVLYSVQSLTRSRCGGLLWVRSASEMCSLPCSIVVGLALSVGCYSYHVTTMYDGRTSVDANQNRFYPPSPVFGCGWDGRVDYCACLESRWPLASWVRIPVPPSFCATKPGEHRVCSPPPGARRSWSGFEQRQPRNRHVS